VGKERNEKERIYRESPLRLAKKVRGERKMGPGVSWKKGVGMREKGGLKEREESVKIAGEDFNFKKSRGEEGRAWWASGEHPQRAANIGGKKTSFQTGQLFVGTLARRK